MSMRVEIGLDAFDKEQDESVKGVMWRLLSTIKMGAMIYILAEVSVSRATFQQNLWNNIGNKETSNYWYLYGSMWMKVWYPLTQTGGILSY
jgi:hypothetical protein